MIVSPMILARRGALALFSAAILATPAGCRGEAAPQRREVIANGSGFLYLRGNEMSPPWRLSLLGASVAVNDSAVKAPAGRPESSEEKLYRRAQGLADSLRVNHTPPDRAARILVDLYRRNGLPARVTVTTEEGAILGARPNEPRTATSKVARLKLPDGRVRKFFIQGQVVNLMPGRENYDPLTPLAEVARALDQGCGIFLKSLGDYTIVPRNRVGEIRRTIALRKAGQQPDSMAARSLSKSEWSDLLSPAPLERLSDGR